MEKLVIEIGRVFDRRFDLIMEELKNINHTLNQIERRGWEND